MENNNQDQAAKRAAEIVRELIRAVAYLPLEVSKAVFDDLAKKLNTAREIIAAEIRDKDAILDSLRAQLSDPPPDVQELVIKKLDLVSRDALQAKDAEIEFLKGRIDRRKA